jgi:hypothetical protein
MRFSAKPESGGIGTARPSGAITHFVIEKGELSINAEISVQCLAISSIK